MLNRLREWLRLLNEARHIPALRAELLLLKSRVDTEPGLFPALAAERLSPAYRQRRENPSPLVSICIATYNRGELVCDRAIASLLEQTHRNIEVIVIGDHCTDDTEARVAAIRDSRLRFVNLPERGNYPEEPHRRWCVAGTTPVNVALSMAEGDFITHLDDDDRHVPDRIEKLLTFVRSEALELAYHPFTCENQNGSWTVNGADRFELGRITSSSIFYDRFFARIPWDIDAHLLDEPGDWNRLRKFAYLGARIGRHPEPLLEHFRERNQRG